MSVREVELVSISLPLVIQLICCATESQPGIRQIDNHLILKAQIYEK